MSFFSFFLTSILTITPINSPTVGVNVSVVKPELNLSYFTIEKIDQDEMTLHLNVTNSGTLPTDSTSVQVMFQDELIYKTSNHKTGILTTEFSRFFKVLRWEIATLAINETQTSDIVFTIPKEQIDQLSNVGVSVVFSTPNGVAFHSSQSLDWSVDQKQSMWSKIMNFFRRMMFWWQAR